MTIIDTIPGHAFRLIDSGVQDGRRQMAYDAALAELHGRGDVPNTIRFMRFPPTVLIGRHQVMSQEVHVDRCRQESVGLVRRVSGGGAIFLDEGQVGWELVFDRSLWPGLSLGDHARQICEAVASGLSNRFGIEAVFRPRNDIEVGGRKLSGTGGYFIGDTLVYQGTVLIDMDAGRMARLLNIPAGKLERHAIDAAARVVTLKELLGSAPSIDEVHAAILAGLHDRLSIDVEPGRLTDQEAVLTEKLLKEEYGSDDFVFGTSDLVMDRPAGEQVQESTSRFAGGTIRTFVRLAGAGENRRIREILITGDFFVAPPRTIYDLEARLRDVPVASVGRAIEDYLNSAQIGLMSLSPENLRDAVLAAIDARRGHDL